MTEDRGYTENEWAGLPHFECAMGCAFDSLDEAAIKEHVAAHRRAEAASRAATAEMEAHRAALQAEAAPEPARKAQEPPETHEAPRSGARSRRGPTPAASASPDAPEEEHP